MGQNDIFIYIDGGVNRFPCSIILTVDDDCVPDIELMRLIRAVLCESLNSFCKDKYYTL